MALGVFAGASGAVQFNFVAFSVAKECHPFDRPHFSSALCAGAPLFVYVRLTALQRSLDLARSASETEGEDRKRRGEKLAKK